MSQRRKIAIITLVLLATAMIVAMSLLFGKGDKKDSKDGYQLVCESLIDAIARKDYDAGYNLLSNSAKRASSPNAWRDTTSIWGNAFYGGKITLVDRTEVQPEGQEESQRAYLSFTVTNAVATSDVSCIAVGNEGGKYVVDGFSSQLRQDEP